MRLAMIGDRIERVLDRSLVVELGCRAKHREPRRALAVVGEQPMDIGARDATIWRDRAVEPSVGEAKERPRAVRPICLADVHFITLKRRAIDEARAFDLGERL